MALSPLLFKELYKPKELSFYKSEDFFPSILQKERSSAGWFWLEDQLDAEA